MATLFSSASDVPFFLPAELSKFGNVDHEKAWISTEERKCIISSLGIVFNMLKVSPIFSRKAGIVVHMHDQEIPAFYECFEGSIKRGRKHLHGFQWYIFHEFQLTKEFVEVLAL